MAILDVPVPELPLQRLASVIGSVRMERLLTGAAHAKSAMSGRTLWNISSTATGGGVAEMLQVLVGYGRGAGLQVRWSVLEGDERFFATTKRLHHQLHGMPGDGQGFDEADREHYRDVLQANAADLLPELARGDVVLLHDPQTAGLAPLLRPAGVFVVWRCHIGADTDNEYTAQAWEFLRRNLTSVDGMVFSRAGYVPAWAASTTTTVMPPSIDPLSPKNQELDPDVVMAILARAGVIRTETTTRATFVRRDGSSGTVVRTASIVQESELPSADTPLVVQISRWDPLKDMSGVMEAFASIAPRCEGELLLVGPATTGVTDDPEGASVFARCVEQWRSLPRATRARIRLLTIPTDDVDENAATINALQRHAAIVVQKSLAEGFGLTVTEAMWKGRAVVASAVGGIRDQVAPGTGVLLDDPRDLAAAAQQIQTLLGDAGLRARLGDAAKRHVRDNYVGDLHLLRYGRLLSILTRR